MRNRIETLPLEDDANYSPLVKTIGRLMEKRLKGKGQERKIKGHGNRATTTLSVKQMLCDRETSAEEDDVKVKRPRCRKDCAAVPRPCPFAGCKYNLYLDVNSNTGTITFNFPDVDITEMPANCALDVAEMGGIPLEAVAVVLNITRERVRQLEAIILDKLTNPLREWENDS